MVPPRVLVPRILFIASVVLLLLFGLVMVYSASSIVALTEFGEDSYFFGKQLLFVVLGLAIAVVLTLLPYRTWFPLSAWGFWFVVIALLALTLLLGFVGLGARRWVNIGFTFQPGELAKIAIMLVSVFLFMEYHERGLSLNWLARFGVAVAGPVLLIALQPDLGTIIFALAGTLVMMWLGEMPRIFFVVALVLLVLVGLIGVNLEDFRQGRVSAFLDPWGDPLKSGYQAVNSFYAFGDGGLLGVGLGNSHQKYYYLPEVQNDFIFAIIGEELGLVGALAVALLFATLVFSGFFIARSAADVKGRMIAGTSAMLIGIQAYYNMLCVLGWAPITGKPLPFISAGGTSMLTSMFLVGMILWVSFHAVEKVSYTRRRDNLVIHEGGRAGGRIPVGPKLPGAGRVPAGPKLPGAGLVPAGLRMPAGSKVPAGVRMPAGGKVPAGVRMPAGGRVPAAARMPDGGKVPTGGKPFANPRQKQRPGALNGFGRPQAHNSPGQVVSLSGLRRARSDLQHLSSAAKPLPLKNPPDGRRRPPTNQRKRG